MLKIIEEKLQKIGDGVKMMLFYVDEDIK